MTVKSHSAPLRRELIARAETYVAAHGLDPHVYRSLGSPGVILFRGYTQDGRPCHGNFIPATYAAILANDAWHERLAKPHQGQQFLAEADKNTAKELGSCCSSDALLMNVFCHPASVTNTQLADIFRLTTMPVPDFGWKPRLPLVSGDTERRSSEIDLRLLTPNRTVLCEAKLTELGFTQKNADHVRTYRDFATVFDESKLPRTGGCFKHYQLIRNVLAAHHHNSAFFLLYDQRRPDLASAFSIVKAAITPMPLSARCEAITWQTIAATLSSDHRHFLEEKYGIL